MSIKKHIPNAITCCNLFSGCIACVMAFNGRFDLAMLFIVVGAVFDFFDGMVARMLHVSSPLGVQMDSLADDVTFGMAPATIVFCYMKDVDVVRHRLVKKVINAYDQYYKKNPPGEDE